MKKCLFYGLDYFESFDHYNKITLLFDLLRTRPKKFFLRLPTVKKRCSILILSISKEIFSKIDVKETLQAYF